MVSTGGYSNKSIGNRIKEFTLYHRDGDGECNNVVLKAWAEKHKLDSAQRYLLSYFFAITYCVESAVILFKDQSEAFACRKSWADRIKGKIVFQSDRKYIRMKNNFEVCLNALRNKVPSYDDFMKKVKRGGRISLKDAIKEVCGWDMFGRFSAYLFLETVVSLNDIEIENTTIDWKNGDTATSGLLNVFGLDNEADWFDKSGELKRSYKEMDMMLSYLLSSVRNAGGDDNVTKVETSLCAYRKFYKGTRYNGYYLDRMLDEINKMRADFPEESAELSEIRTKHFPEKQLGEIGGWRGIRRELKKLYKETGLI